MLVFSDSISTLPYDHKNNLTQAWRWIVREEINVKTIVGFAHTIQDYITPVALQYYECTPIAHKNKVIYHVNPWGGDKIAINLPTTFQVHSLESKSLHIDSNFTEICSQEPNQQDAGTALGHIAL